MKIDYSRDKLLSEFGVKTMRDRYMLPTEKSPQDAFARVSKAFADDDAHAQRLYDYCSKLWFMFSSPILSNGGTERGLPISCFLNYVPDSRVGITDHYTENAFLTSMGGGIGSYWGHLRAAGQPTSKGSESTGPIPFIKVVDAQMLAFSQGVTRRGSAAVYMDINHPEIEEFLDIRKPTGDTNRKSTNLHHGVVIPDTFMELVYQASTIPGFDDSWPLIDPHTGATLKVVQAKTIWIKLLENRLATGEPYIMWGDAVNRALPEFQKRKGLKVYQSNLCTEITLPTNSDRTAVCCLSSLNAEEYDSWKHDPNFILDISRMLDNVLTYFINNAPPELHKAVYSATQERSIGIGLMGLHAWFQRHNIPYESIHARNLNKEIFVHIYEKSYEASQILGAERGECPDGIGSGHRFAHRMAPAPNATSSIICGDTSPATELYPANAYTRKTTSGSCLLKNEYLEHVLQEIGQDTPEVWKSIVTNDGSVQHLDFLDKHTKNVFKTAREVDQSYVIAMAIDRTPYICQSHSVNLYYPSNVNKKVLHDHHMAAWKGGMKTLYYLRGGAAQKTENVSEMTTRKDIFNSDECQACEG